ncbi:MAG: hypothetical protein CSA62_07950 [Planctomycetota bacterium]|nr:MAG: hypothetical protein CSA62_07950 [Planctomycetota bacterium]
MRTFSELLLRHRRLAAFLIFAMTLALVPGVFRLGVGYSVESFLRSDDAELQREVELYEKYPMPDTFFSFGLPADDPIAESTLKVLEHFEETMLKVEGVDAIITVRNAPGLAGLARAQLEEKLKKSSLYRRLFVSFPNAEHDGALAGLVQLSEDARNNQDRTRIFRRMREIASTMPALRSGDQSLVLRSAGLPVLREQFVALVKRDQQFFLPVGAGLTILFLLFLLPGFGLTIATVSIVPFTLIWTFGLLGYLGCELSLLTSTLPILLMVISTADAVHMTMRYWEERRDGRDCVAASQHALRRTAFPCLVTTLTTMIGFGSMLLAEVPDLQDLGLFAAMGVLLAFLLTILFLPVCLPWCAERFGEADPATEADSGLFGLRRSVPFGALSRWLGMWPKLPVLGVFSVLIVLSAISAMRLPQNSYVTEDLWPDSPPAKEIAWFDKHFLGSLPGEILVSSEDGQLLSKDGRAELAQFIDWLEQQYGVIRSLSYIDWLKDGYPSLLLPALSRPPLSLFDEELKTARVLFFMEDIGAVALNEFFEDVHERSEELQHLDLRPTGFQVVANKQVTRLIEEVKVSFFFAFVVISVLMGVVFRSLRHGLIAVVPNSFPLLLTAAFMYVSNQHLRIVAVMTFAIAFGLAVDNTIHIFVRYRREQAKGGSVDAAVARALASVGDAVWTTSLLLLVGFCVLFFSGFKASYDFGVLACVTILAALFGDLLLLPALLRLLGRPAKGKLAQDEPG